jgi:xylan 1,4-beta-xylosidase
MAAVLCGQTPVQIEVDAAHSSGAIQPIWRFFGYDEPNYTYTQNGMKLLAELSKVSSKPVYIRTHFLLATGNGEPSLKWGSTNVYSIDKTGRPAYDWRIVDRIFDTWLHNGTKPFVEVGFMPEALSTHPSPYRVEWIPGAPNKDYFAGWTYPPKDFDTWRELIMQFIQHVISRYVRAEVATWYWEVWNEPDIGYWHGTPDEYDQLYDVSAEAIKRVLPEARVGGPAGTGPAGTRAAAFLKQFLEHCEKNASPLDFISFHAKGQPVSDSGHVRMGFAKHTLDVQSGFEIVSSFPRFARLPIVLSESDPEGCAACSARLYPQNAYRNGELYAVYNAAIMKTIFDLADRSNANIEGMLTWAFEFEDQPWFDGLRTLATNGVDKPVLNFFHMAALLAPTRIPVKSSATAPLSARTAGGAHDVRDVSAIASRDDHRLTVMLWNYSDNPASAEDVVIDLKISHAPAASATCRRFQIDSKHSNSWTAWKELGSPQHLTAAQIAMLEKAARLQEIEPAKKVSLSNLKIMLPGESLALLEFTW